MLIFAALAALHLILVHRVDGGVVAINPAAVTSLHSTRKSVGGDNTLMTHGAHCVIGLNDGKVVSVIETCDQVRQMLEDTSK